MLTHLNTYNNVTSPAFTSSTTNLDWIKQIISPSQEIKQTINTARKIKQLYLETADKDFDEKYKKIKKTLPAITWNATFSDNYKKDENYQCGTGLLYIDIDHQDFDISTLDTSKVYVYYKSVGGLGYSIIVKVDGINPNNFNYTFYSITNELNITKYIDTNAVKLTQFSIISYDVNLFINDNSYVFSSVNDDLIDKNYFTPNHLINRKEKHNELSGGKTDLQQIIEQNNIRYTNIDEFDFSGNEVITNWNDRFNFIQCWTPFKPINDGRKRIMMNYIRNLVYLNNSIDKLLLINSSMFVNKRICETPLEYKKIKEFVELIIKQKNEGKLTPKITKKIILFNPKVPLTESKLKLWGKAQTQQYTAIGCDRIYNVIEDWNFEFNGKITGKSIADNSNLNIKTVEKYLHNFKEYIKELNEANQDEI